MQITRTVNANQRYYLDETTIENADSFVETMKVFNAAKIDLYNQEYEERYNNNGILTTMKPHQFLKMKYDFNAYYQAAVTNEVSGIMSSQVQLQKLYKKNYQKDVDTREDKINSIIKQLDKKLSVKQSLVIYAKTGKWNKPYPKCQIKVFGKDIYVPGIHYNLTVDEYERSVEKDIRKLKNRLSHLEYGLKRKQHKLDNITNLQPKRIIFGSKKLLSEKDRIDVSYERWHEEFDFVRMSSMTIPGRHDAKYCNFLCIFKSGDLHFRNIDGTETVFKGFMVSRYKDEFLDYFTALPKDRKALCYNFNLKRDQYGRIYVLVSVTLVLENSYTNYSKDTGCVSIDLNYDHVALSDIDENGNLLDSQIIRFDIWHKSSCAITDIIGRIMSKVGAYVESRNKILIMEDIDTTRSKHGMRYGNSKRNKRASMFAYHKMTACLFNQAYKRGFEIECINPAYTSQMGKFLYMKQKGLSIHQAASYCIGLKGLELIDKITPDDRLLNLLPRKTVGKLTTPLDIKSVCLVWREISTVFSKVPKHFFYMGIPYSKLDTMKKPLLRTLSREMVSWIDI